MSDHDGHTIDIGPVTVGASGGTRWRIAVVVEVIAETEKEAEAAGWQVAEASDMVLECEGIWTEPLYVDRDSLGKIERAGEDRAQ